MTLEDILLEISKEWDGIYENGECLLTENAQNLIGDIVQHVINIYDKDIQELTNQINELKYVIQESTSQDSKERRN
jgi:hypothetical protein